MKLYDSLTKETREFQPIDPKRVKMYLCGPTVYDYVHIGNHRTYVLGDLVHRNLLFNDYKVNYIINLTDVGHLTGDNEGDADTGEDRVELAVAREGKSAKEISGFYTKDFLTGYKFLNMLQPKKFIKATEYIGEQVDLILKLEEKGYTYTISDGVYFDTSKFEDYGKLSGSDADSLKEGARVAVNPEKKNPVDFALWKFSPEGSVRQQEWDSPWGIGFPGWHIECSAMCMKELGNTIDIHLGGEDLRMVHHQNEIAQSEASTGEKFVNYWMHGAFLTVDGGKMGKSLGNAYTLNDILDKKFNPLALRYLFLTAHYRSPLNFTWEALENAQNSLKKLYSIISGYEEDASASPDGKYLLQFKEALNDDINAPNALASLWDLLKSSLSEEVKIATAVEMDKVLGLKIADHVGFEIPQDVLDKALARSEYRKVGIWDKADMIRRELDGQDYVIEDLSDGTYKVKRKV